MICQLTALFICSLISFSLIGQATQPSLKQKNNNLYSFRINAEMKISAQRYRNANLRTVLAPRYRLDSVIEYNYNEISSEWDRKFTKQSYGYDDDYNNTLFLLESWDPDLKQWVKLWREASTFNEYGNITSYEAFAWGRAQQWAPMFKDEYIYDENQKLVESKLFYWKYVREDWAFLEKIKHYYDSDGNLLADTTYSRYESTDDWVFSKLVQYDYSNGYLERTQTSEWDAASLEWIPVERRHKLYDSDTWNLFGAKRFVWDEVTSDWILEEVESYGFDNEDNINICTKTVWGANAVVYIDNYKTDNSVGKEELILPLVLESHDLIAFHHMILSKDQRQIKRNSADDSEKYREIKYYYTAVDLLTGVDEEYPENISVFPNPANESIEIRCPENYKEAIFEAFDSRGHKVLSRSITNHETIEIGSFRQGLYVYNIYFGNKVVRGKLVKN